MKKHEKRRSTKKKKQAKTEMHRKEEAPVFAKSEREGKRRLKQKRETMHGAPFCAVCVILLHCATREDAVCRVP